MIVSLLWSSLQNKTHGNKKNQKHPKTQNNMSEKVKKCLTLALTFELTSLVVQCMSTGNPQAVLALVSRSLQFRGRGTCNILVDVEKRWKNKDRRSYSLQGEGEGGHVAGVMSPKTSLLLLDSLKGTWWHGLIVGDIGTCQTASTLSQQQWQSEQAVTTGRIAALHIHDVHVSSYTDHSSKCCIV